jgi:hypothetical protein
MFIFIDSDATRSLAMLNGSSNFDHAAPAKAEQSLKSNPGYFSREALWTRYSRRVANDRSARRKRGTHMILSKVSVLVLLTRYVLGELKRIVFERLENLKAVVAVEKLV